MGFRQIRAQGTRARPLRSSKLSVRYRPGLSKTLGRVGARDSIMAGGANERTKVFLYYPNLIGYLRVIFTLLSFWYGVKGREYWAQCVCCYFLGFFGDVVDGHVARMFDQSSEFGAVLDMVTDRTSTAGLVMLNLRHTPVDQEHWALFWIVLVVVDIGSHWFHCISTAKSGGHHKSAETLKDRVWLLRLYYGVFPFFAFCCVGQELFYLTNLIANFQPDLLGSVPLGKVLGSLLDSPGAKALHIKHQDGQVHTLMVLWVVTLLACLIKQVVNVAQLLSAACALADVDVRARGKRRSTSTTTTRTTSPTSPGGVRRSSSAGSSASEDNTPRRITRSSKKLL